MIGELVALVVATVEAAGDDVEDVPAEVAPAVLGAPAEQAASESALRPTAMVEASAVRVMCVGMRHLRSRR
ncbi:hypothetical protein ASE25_03115 [Terrabacter sp. Root85]|nr:hypothetical protein ASE25_03115 [Terrabacter sp. Root85]